MPGVAAWARGGAAVGAGLSLFALYPLLVHGAIVADLDADTALILALVQAGVTGLVIGRAAPRFRWVALAGAIALFGLSWRSARDGLLAASAISHAAIYVGLLTLFARTLLAGREPLITWVARRIRGSLTDEMLVYTRRVTIAWCLFFAGQLAMSALLFVSAPPAFRSFFINVLDLPLVAAMFLAEYAYRLRKFRNHSHGSIADVVRVFSERPTP
ncbi:hypothetical protein JHL17_14250 [Azospirillum sp. YIM B02556]|uniref:Transmembrane protein n=1 Tax=Azospirillum endophyticum TaxID=2800326 RepID=A0ABS1F597_9PROT|nr:hypothetical protein [Azospirillum endophyticum]MBK1838578.1 hypothetical protein [Azospirillum endophyticum]